MKVAVFPLALVRGALHWHHGMDVELADRFGWMRMRKMTPAVWYRAGGLEQVHCGPHPLMARAWMWAWAHHGYVGAICYINDHGEHCYPA